MRVRVLEAGLDTDKRTNVVPWLRFVGGAQNGDGFNALRHFYAQFALAHDGGNGLTVAVRNLLVRLQL